MNPLVSILIPAYNSQEWIAETIQSALGQTWPRKEIIVVDDGSTDRTGDIARQFASKQVQVIRKENGGAAAARNHAYSLAQGDYLQWLDADDLLGPEKIERQLEALRESGSNRTLLSSAWAYFNYRMEGARFIPTLLWQDLSPVEWLLLKMRDDLYMQTATWLTSRELAEAAGPWDTRLMSDDDVEYFCRVLRASDGIKFVPEARVFYRNTESNRLSYIGNSDKKKNALMISLELQVQYLRSLEESDRVRKACLAYLQSGFIAFYPERADIVDRLERLAEQLQGRLEEPRLRWKYAWMKPLFGWKAAKWAQNTLPQYKLLWLRRYDRAIHRVRGNKLEGNRLQPANGQSLRSGETREATAKFLHKGVPKRAGGEAL